MSIVVSILVNGLAACTSPPAGSMDGVTCGGKCDSGDEPLLAYVNEVSGDTLGCIRSRACSIYGRVTVPDGGAVQLSTLMSELGLWQEDVARAPAAALVGRWTVSLYDEQGRTDPLVLRCELDVTDAMIQSGEARNASCMLEDGRPTSDDVTLAFRSVDRYPVTIQNDCASASFIGRSYFGGRGDEAFASTELGALPLGKVEGMAHRGELLHAISFMQDGSPELAWLPYHGESDVVLDDLCQLHIP